MDGGKKIILHHDENKSTKNIKIIGTKLQEIIEKNPLKKHLGNLIKMVIVMENLCRIDHIMVHRMKEHNQAERNMRDTKGILIHIHTTDGRGAQSKPTIDSNH